MQQQTQTKEQRSKFQMVLDHMRDARSSMTAAAQVLSNLVFDLQKGEDWIHGFELTLIKTIEDSGGTVDVEAEIKEFIPKSYRRPEGTDQAQE
jgi:hypothetical protein